MNGFGQQPIRSVLAVEAHPDDVELTCLGTLLSLREQGSDITIVSITDGTNGASHTPSQKGQDIAKTRHAEATAVADALGGRFLTLGGADGFLYDTEDLRRRLAKLIHEVQADVVIAPPPRDYHADHIATSELAFSAVYYAWTEYGASLRSVTSNESAQAKPLNQMPALYYCDSITSLNFEPSFFVDISAYFEEKKRLVAMHKSQMENVKAVSGRDLVEFVQIVGEFRGLQSGTRAAEAFQSCLSWPRVRALPRFPGSVGA